MEAAQVSFSRWVDKKAVVHLHNGILLGCKKGKKFTLFKKDFIYLILEKEGMEKERERNINVWLLLVYPLWETTTQACALTGNQTGDPLVSRPVLNPLSHTTQGKNFTLWDNMDKSGEHYAKWNKPVRERQRQYDVANMWNLMNKLN